MVMPYSNPSQKVNIQNLIENQFKIQIDAILTPEEQQDFLNSPLKYKERIKTKARFQAERELQGLQVAIDTKESLLARWEEIFEETFAMLLPPNMSPQLANSLEVLNIYGVQKDAHTNHPAHSETQSLTHKFSRVVMRYPNQEVLAQLHFLHSVINNEFNKMNDAEIDWLLGGAPMARGGFENAKHFKTFFAKNPQEISSSRLITAIDTITTAIAYRTIGASWTIPPHNPNILMPGYDMQKKLKATFIKGFIDIIYEKAYTAREFDIQDGDDSNNNIEALADNVSVVSDIDDEPKAKSSRRMELPNKTYRTKIYPSDVNYTWPGAAALGNIPIRSHVSGSTPMVLSIIETFYKKYKNRWFSSGQKAKMLAGALLIPAYERGDFHTVAETAAGIEYYIETKNSQPQTYGPRTCLQKGLDAMVEATDKRLQPHLEIVSKHIMAQTKYLPCAPTMDFRRSLETIKFSDDKPLIFSLINKNIQEISSIDVKNHEKIDKLKQTLDAINDSIELRKQRGFWSIFFKTGKTPDWKECVKAIKAWTLDILKNAEPGSLDRLTMQKVRQILHTHRHRGSFFFKTTSEKNESYQTHLEVMTHKEKEEKAMDKIFASSAKMYKSF